MSLAYLRSSQLCFFLLFIRLCIGSELLWNPSWSCCGPWRRPDPTRARCPSLSVSLVSNAVSWDRIRTLSDQTLGTPQTLCQKHRKRTLPPRENVKNSRKFVRSKKLFCFVGFVFVCSCLFYSRIMLTQLTASHTEQNKRKYFTSFQETGNQFMVYAMGLVL